MNIILYRPDKTTYRERNEIEFVECDPFEGQVNYDYMGLNEDDIDDVFDGDPSAYWNID